MDRAELAAEKEAIFALLAELAALDGVAGFEGPVVRRLVDLFRPLADEVQVDRFGNVIATKRGAAGPTLMVGAHSDEIGAVVRAVEPDGLLRMERIGGVIETTLVGRRVRVNGLRGVVGVRAGHVQAPDERLRVPPLRDLYVDLGLDSAAAVREAGIRVGDPIAYESEMVRLANPDRVSGKALDNRISCAILLRLFRRLHDAGTALRGTLHGVVTVQEEVGLRGAQVVTYRLDPDYAIVVDTLPAAGTPDVNFTKELAINLGRGPVIPLVSGGGGRGNIMHPALKRLLLDTAEREGIPVQPAIFTQGNSDVAAVHLVREGIPAGVVNIPRRYSHTPVETADLNDAANALRLIEAVVRDLGPDVNLDFLQDGGPE
ncbi:MAG TPA: M20/M25/M40 family metallo-hydrolase [Thermomicrobiales bacterium]|nr:M20/M25/M40 family metallo-hydrolase [Thermomicrobiales bacterium]